MGTLTVTTFGEPCIRHDGVLSPLTIRKALALAVYLAVTAQSHPRLRLGALLWPDADEAHSLLNLRQTLLRLRHGLGADADAHLVTSGDLVRLDLGPGGRVDVTHLAAATAPQTPAAQRLAALHHYAGAFLASLTIDDAPDFMAWVAAQRAHWEACYDLVAEEAVQELFNDGQADAVLHMGHTWVAHRPDSEAAYRALATAQAMSGDVGAARLTLARAARQWAELGLDLAPATRDLSAHLTQVVPVPDPPRHALRLPFVGRGEAFAPLRRAFTRAQTGQTQMVLVQGEAGLGKSRLVEAFTHWAEIGGADVAVGHAYELSGRLPYHPLMELLRGRLARERAPDDLLEDSWLIELQRLVPELHDRYPDLPPPVDDAAAGTRLVEAVAQLGIVLARQRPVVWLVEDLHWADEDTRDSLLYLLRRCNEAHVPVLVVCTVRPEAIARVPTLAAWLDALPAVTRLTTVPLTALSAAGMTQALTTLLAGTPPPALAAWMYDQTQGNPLYLEHVLQALVERGVVQWQQDQPHLVADVAPETLAGWFPETLRGLLLRRVRHLEPMTQQVLAAAAIVGIRFREELLLPVSGADENSLLSALETAERSLLIRPDVEHYRFTHDKVAEALYGDLTPARRRVLHRRALQALETEGSSPSAELARHALAAEAWEKAAHYLLQAAEAARQIGSYESAIYFYERVHHLLRTSPSHERLLALFKENAHEKLYHPLGLLYANRDGDEKAYAFYEEVLAEVRMHGMRLVEGEMHYLLGKLAANKAEAQRLIEAARQIAQEQGNIRGMMKAERELAHIAHMAENVVLAEYHTTHVMHQAREHQEYLMLTQILNMHYEICIHQGRWEAACAAIEESITLLARLVEEETLEGPISPSLFTNSLTWREFFPKVAALLKVFPTPANNRARQWGADGLVLMGVGRLHLGEGACGRAAVEMGWRIWSERNELQIKEAILLEVSLGNIENGTYEVALRRARETTDALSQSEYTSIDMYKVRSLCGITSIFHALYQVTEAHRCLEQASALAQDTSRGNRLLLASRWVVQHALAGDWELAYAATLAAQTIRESTPTQLNAFDFSRYYETEALLRAGERTRAENDAHLLFNALGDNRRYRLVWLRMAAVLARDEGDHTAALAHLAEAQDLATALVLPGEAWQIANEQSASAAHLGDAPQAQAMRAAAAAGIARLAEAMTDPVLREHYARTASDRRPALS